MIIKQRIRISVITKRYNKLAPINFAKQFLELRVNRETFVSA